MIDEKGRIEIIEGHDPSSYFWIKPVNVKDTECDTDNWDNIIEFNDMEVSIEEDNIVAYLYEIFLKFYDNKLIYNINRGKNHDEMWNERYNGSEFEYYLTHNFYTMESIENMIKYIYKVIELLKDDYDNKEIDYLKKHYSYLAICLNHDVLPEEELNKIVEAHKDMIIDFYERFNNYLENMVKKGKIKGYKLISIMGP